MIQENKIGVAIVGCGYWGVNYVRVFDQLPETFVAVICDKNVERLVEIGERFPDAAVTHDVEQMLQMPTVDVVVVATGATTHYPVVKRCLEANKPVLVEKPMTTTVEESLDLVKTAQERNLTLMVGHIFLYNSGVEKVRELVEHPDMGQLYYLYSRRTNLGPIRHDVNALWDLAPHDISVFNELVGEMPVWVSATGSKLLGNAREDVGFITLGYRNNVIGNIHVSWADPNKVREMVVVGSNKRIVFDDTQALERVKIYEKGVEVVHGAGAESFGEEFQMRDGDIYSPYIKASEPLKRQCRHFLDCAMNGKRPITDARAGLEIVQVMVAIQRSMASKGSPVPIEQLLPTEPKTEYHNLAVAAD